MGSLTTIFRKNVSLKLNSTLLHGTTHKVIEISLLPRKISFEIGLKYVEPYKFTNIMSD